MRIDLEVGQSSSVPAKPEEARSRIEYTIYGSTSRSVVEAFASANIPATDGSNELVRIEIKELNDERDGSWTAIAYYEAPPDQDESSGGSPVPKEVAVGFDIGSTTQKVTHAKSTIASYAAPGEGTPPDLKNAINVVDGKPEGVDWFFGETSFSVEMEYPQGTVDNAAIANKALLRNFNVLWVRNDTGVDYARLDIFSITVPAFDDDDVFKNEPAVVGVLDNPPNDRIAVSLNAIKAGRGGWCQVGGVTPVRVNIVDVNDRHARYDGERTRLKSGPGGWSIVAQQNGTGQRLAYVNLSNYRSSGAGAIFYSGQGVTERTGNQPGFADCDRVKINANRELEIVPNSRETLYNIATGAVDSNKYIQAQEIDNVDEDPVWVIHFEDCNE